MTDHNQVATKITGTPLILLKQKDPQTTNLWQCSVKCPAVRACTWHLRVLVIRISPVRSGERRNTWDEIYKVLNIFIAGTQVSGLQVTSPRAAPWGFTPSWSSLRPRPRGHHKAPSWGCPRGWRLGRRGQPSMRTRSAEYVKWGLSVDNIVTFLTLS